MINKTELTKLNVGYNLDWLMNLDPRGYGVCRILYDGASKYTGKPLSLNGAEGLVKNIKRRRTETAADRRAGRIPRRVH